MSTDTKGGESTEIKGCKVKKIDSFRGINSNINVWMQRKSIYGLCREGEGV